MDKKDFIRLIKRYGTVKKWPNGQERADINIEEFATHLESVFNKTQDNIEPTDLKNYFKRLRFDKSHHLGLGDIRLTIAQQEEICLLSVRQPTISDEQLTKIAKEQILYNDQKREWWTEGAKYIRDLQNNV